MKRSSRFFLVAPVVLGACNAILGIGELVPPQPAITTEGGISPLPDAKVLVDAGPDGGLGPSEPEDVFVTTAKLVDVGVGEKLYMMLPQPSRIESCALSACSGSRNVEVGPTRMPSESPSATLPTFTNAALAVMHTSAGTEVLIVAQTGNSPCKPCGVPPDNPSVFLVGADLPKLLLRLASEGPWDVNNAVFDFGRRGNSLWYGVKLQPDTLPTNGVTYLKFGGADRATFGPTFRREDQRREGPTTARYFVAAHQQRGVTFMTRADDMYYGELVTVDETSLDASADMPVGVSTPHTIAATANFAFVTTTDTETKESGTFIRVTPTEKTTVVVPEVTPGDVVVGAELGLAWYPRTTTSPIELRFCSDASLVVVKNCVPRHVKLDLDRIDVIREDASYLYVIGGRAGKSAIIRFRP